MKYKNEKLKAYTSEIKQRMESVLPAKNKNDLMLKMFFSNRKQITPNDALEFYHWICQNDSEIRTEIWSMIDKGLWTWDIGYKNIRLA